MAVTRSKVRAENQKASSADLHTTQRKLPSPKTTSEKGRGAGTGREHVHNLVNIQDESDEEAEGPADRSPHSARWSWQRIMALILFLLLCPSLHVFTQDRDASINTKNSSSSSLDNLCNGEGLPPIPVALHPILQSLVAVLPAKLDEAFGNNVWLTRLPFPRFRRAWRSGIYHLYESIDSFTSWPSVQDDLPQMVEAAKQDRRSATKLHEKINRKSSSLVVKALQVQAGLQASSAWPNWLKSHQREDLILAAGSLEIVSLWSSELLEYETRLGNRLRQLQEVKEQHLYPMLQLLSKAVENVEGGSGGVITPQDDVDSKERWLQHAALHLYLLEAALSTFTTELEATAWGVSIIRGYIVESGLQPLPAGNNVVEGLFHRAVWVLSGFLSRDTRSRDREERQQQIDAERRNFEQTFDLSHKVWPLLLIRLRRDVLGKVAYLSKRNWAAKRASLDPSCNQALERLSPFQRRWLTMTEYEAGVRETMLRPDLPAWPGVFDRRRGGDGVKKSRRRQCRDYGEDLFDEGVEREKHIFCVG